MCFKTAVISLAAGMAVGATVVLVLPRSHPVRHTMQMAADCLEDAVDCSMRCIKKMG